MGSLGDVRTLTFRTDHFLKRPITSVLLWVQLFRIATLTLDSVVRFMLSSAESPSAINASNTVSVCGSALSAEQTWNSSKNRDMTVRVLDVSMT